MGFLNRDEKRYRSKLSQVVGILLVISMLVIIVLWLGFFLLVDNSRTDAEAAAKKDAAERKLATELKEALNAGDQPAISRIYAELKESEPKSSDIRHLLCVTAYQQNELEFANQLLDELAPENGTGFGLSHYLKALNISKREGMVKDDFEDMVRHLQIAVRSEDIPNDAYRLLGDGHFFLKEFKHAISSYRKIEKPTPETQYKIGLAFLGTQNQQQAVEEMALAAERLGEKYRTDPSDLKSLVLSTKALFFAGRVNEAEEVLLNALEKNDNVVIRNELIQTYLEQFKRAGNLVRRKEILQRICQLDPSMRIHPQTRAAFFELATFLVKEQRYEEAKAYYQICASRIDFPASIKNNLAWLEMKLPNGDLEQALKLADEAVKDPQDTRPEFFGTRGQVLARLGQWEKAKPDLEKAVTEIAQKNEVQSALAVVLARLGDQESAKSMYATVKDPKASFEELLKQYPN